MQRKLKTFYTCVARCAGKAVGAWPGVAWPGIAWRWALRCAAGGALMTSVAHANSPLPIGFGAIKIGQPWVQVEGTVTYKDLTDESTLPERLGHECGYKSLVVTTDEGELLITTNDFIVTGLAYVTPIEQGSSVSSVADLVMQTYGQPRSAFMRNALGQATIDRDAVTHIELTYEAEHPVSFFISGDSLWQ